MWKMCLSQKAQEEQSKKDEWFSSLQYLNASINDLSISESFLDNASGFNLATAEALGWYTDVAIILRDEKGNPIIAGILVGCCKAQL